MGTFKSQDHIKTFLDQKNIKVPEGWIPACIEFIKAEHGNNKNTGNAMWLKEKVFEQWLHADLTELGTCCLPFNLNKHKCMTLRGAFALQVNHVKDIGLPCYSQLQKLRKDDIENAKISTDKTYAAAWEPKPSRMLLLQLTDGTSIVQGMEYQPINSLYLGMKPGTKVLIQGLVETRRGIMMLTKDHVTVLGGEVDSLLVPNAPENIIRKTLRLETSENPIPIPGSFSIEATQNENPLEYYNTQSTQKSIPASFSHQTKRQSGINYERNPREVQTPAQFTEVFEDDFEDFYDMETEKALIEAEKSAISSSFAGRNRNSQSVTSANVQPFASSSAAISASGHEKSDAGGTKLSSQSEYVDLFDDDDDDLLLAAVDIPPVLSNTKATSISNHLNRETRSSNSLGLNCKSNQFVPKSGGGVHKRSNDGSSAYSFNTSSEKLPDSKNTVGVSNTLPQAFSGFQNSQKKLNSNFGVSSEIQSSSSKSKLSSFIFEKKPRNDRSSSSSVTKTVKDNCIRTVVQSSSPFQYLCFMDLNPSHKVYYTIKGFVTTLLSKLDQTYGKWSLAAKINDGTASCDVDVDDKVLRKLIGMDVDEFKTKKEEALSNAALRKSLGERLCNCQMELIKMCCLLIVEIEPSSSKPRVMDVKQLTSIHLQQIKERSIPDILPTP